MLGARSAVFRKIETIIWRTWSVAIQNQVLQLSTMDSRSPQTRQLQDGKPPLCSWTVVWVESRREHGSVLRAVSSGRLTRTPGMLPQGWHTGAGVDQDLGQGCELGRSTPLLPMVSSVWLSPSAVAGFQGHVSPEAGSGNCQFLKG